MAAKETPYDILLLGRTGMGKSTTGNHLVENRDGARIVDVLFDTEIRRQQKVTVAEKSLTEFKHSDGIESCTEWPDVLHNLETGIRVMDTKGFVDCSGQFTRNGATSNNLSSMRSILTWQSETGMSFRRVLYFLPSRAPLEGCDHNLLEEVEIMLHFFGAGVFNCMVLVFTLHPDMYDVDTPAAVGFKTWESKTKDVMLAAIRRTAERLEVKLPKDFECPPVVFIPKSGPSDKVITAVTEAKVLVDEPYSFAFRKTTCVKCAGHLKFPSADIQVGDDDYNIMEFGNTPVSVKYDNDAPIEFAKSKCHPSFVSKYSFGQKLGGGLAHIAASLGILHLAEVAKEADYMPYFGNSEEVCVTCKKPPGSRGCMTVNTHWKTKSPKQPTIVVTHCNH